MAASQSFERLFSEALLLWPVERVSNKAVSERAGWLAGFRDSPLYMWRALQFAGKMRRDKEQKHFLAVRAESQCVAPSRPVTGVNAADVDSDMCHRSFCN